MRYEQLIKSWHLKATQEDYFSKFMFEYLAFIAYLNSQLYTDSEYDRQAIQRLKGGENIKKRYLQRINRNRILKNSWEKIKAELDRVRLGNSSRGNLGVEEIKWWNCSHDRLNQMTHKERAKKQGVLHSLKDWENMVEFWYSIRNNLFHGTKDPARRRDKLLVEHGYKTLNPLVEMLIEDL